MHVARSCARAHVKLRVLAANSRAKGRACTAHAVIFRGKPREKCDTMIVEEEDKRKWKENRSCRLRSARLSVVDYEVAISQCARAWFIVDLFLEISANFAIGSRLAREGRRDGKRQERGKRTWELQSGNAPIRRAVNQLSLHLPPNVAILRFASIRSFYSRLRPSRTFPPPPRVLRRLFHQWIYGMSTRFVLGRARARRHRAITKAMSSESEVGERPWQIGPSETSVSTRLMG